MAPALDDSAIGSDSNDSSARKPKGGKGKIIALVLVLMAAEGGLMWMFLPSAQGTQSTSVAVDPLERAAGSIAEASDLVEVEFQPGFNCTNSTADLGTLVHVNFSLVAAVSSKNAQAFSTAIKNDFKNRVRQAIVHVARSASLEELQDPDLNQLKRRIREDINKTLQNSYVVDVIIPDIQVHVQ